MKKQFHSVWGHSGAGGHSGQTPTVSATEHSWPLLAWLGTAFLLLFSLRGPPLTLVLVAFVFLKEIGK